MTYPEGGRAPKRPRASRGGLQLEEDAQGFTRVFFVQRFCGMCAHWCA